MGRYLMTTDKRGGLSSTLAASAPMRRYETAFMMLHKLRRAIVNSAHEPLKGEIEVDAWVGSD